MSREPDFFQNLQSELSNGRAWLDRSVIVGYGAAAGLCVVLFTYMSETAFEWFQHLYAAYPWAVLVWTPTLTAFIVWCTRRYFPGAAGSGIPQVMTALDPDLPRGARHLFVSSKLTAAKVVLGSLSLLAGLSAGREGPSVQVGAGVMHGARRWLSPRSNMNDQALLVAGGAAGIAAAFNAPLAGVVFAIEELSKRMASRNNSLIISAIVVAGLVSISFFGNLTYFGSIAVPRLSWGAFWPGLLVVLTCGVLGGLFARLLAASIEGTSDRFSEFRRQYPVRFAAAVGLLIATIGLVTGGATFGAGADEVRHMLAGEGDASRLYVLLKLVATWLTTWSGVPGGIFAPSLSIGAGVGHDVAQIFAGENFKALMPALVALGMASFLAATTQAPLTSFIIVMEMINGRSMVLSLMAAAMLASLISRLICRPLYQTLSELMIQGAQHNTTPPAWQDEADAPTRLEPSLGPLPTEPPTDPLSPAQTTEKEANGVADDPVAQRTPTDLADPTAQGNATASAPALAGTSPKESPSRSAKAKLPKPAMDQNDLFGEPPENKQQP